MTSDAPTTAVSDQQITDWWNGLSRFHQKALEVASEEASNQAILYAQRTLAVTPAAWRTLETASQEAVESAHFNSALSTLMQIEPEESHVDGCFRTISMPDIAVMAADHETNKHRACVRSLSKTDTDAWPCPSILSGTDYVSETVPEVKAIPSDGWEAKWIKDRDRYDTTRMMVLMALECSSEEEARQVANSDHCPSGFKDDASGIVSLYNRLQSDNLPNLSSRKAPWDSTQNRQPIPLSRYDGVEFMRKSALRLTPKNFERFGKPPLPQVEALHMKAANMATDGNSSRTDNGTNQGSVTFDGTASPKSGIIKNLLSLWRSRKGSSESAIPASDTNTAAAQSTQSTVPPTSKEAIAAYLAALPSSSPTAFSSAASPAGGVGPHSTQIQTPTANLSTTAFSDVNGSSSMASVGIMSSNISVGTAGTAASTPPPSRPPSAQNSNISLNSMSSKYSASTAPSTSRPASILKGSSGKPPRKGSVSFDTRRGGKWSAIKRLFGSGSGSSSSSGKGSIDGKVIRSGG